MFTQTKSAWASKINWVEIIKMAGVIAPAAGLVVPPDLVPAVVGAVSAVGGLVTIVMRTWFTTKMTKATANRVGAN